MRKHLFAAVISLCVSSQILAAANPQYNPNWSNGQQFNVTFNFTSLQDLKQPEQAPPINISVTYTYNVSITIENGHKFATIVVTPDLDGWSQWRLRMDAENIVLLSVDEVGVPIHYDNPFGQEAWMAKIDQYNRIIIHDFPKIPATSQNESRAIGAAGSTPGFTQTVTFGSSDVIVRLSRVDPETSLPETTDFLWRAGDPWWSSATIKLGTDTVITANLVH
jgi:hypothetical protein